MGPVPAVNGGGPREIEILDSKVVRNLYFMLPLVVAPVMYLALFSKLSPFGFLAAAVLMLSGVFAHETGHYVTAKLFGAANARLVFKLPLALGVSFSATLKPSAMYAVMLAGLAATLPIALLSPLAFSALLAASVGDLYQLALWIPKRPTMIRAESDRTVLILGAAGRAGS